MIESIKPKEQQKKFKGICAVKIKEACKVLQEVFYHVLQVSEVDFTIGEAHRPTYSQKIMYEKKTSIYDGVKRVGPHNILPTRAIDIRILKDGRLCTDKTYFLYINGIVQSIAYMHNVKIQWGNECVPISQVKDYRDLVHFEYLP